MLGRRGPAQAAFTNPELKEFGEIEGVDPIVDPADLELDESSLAALESDKTARKNVELLRAYATRTANPDHSRIVMRYLVSPVEVIGEEGKITAVKIEKNRLELQSNGSLRAVGTGEFETLEAGLIFRSVGYRGVPLQGVPFDESTGTIANVAGRIIHASTGDVVPGEYVVGWAKRGPSGIIGTNKPDSVATVAAMLEDLAELNPIADDKRDLSLVENLLKERNLKYITYEDWLKLNKIEVSRGAEQGRSRVKFTRVSDMLEALTQN